MKKRSSYSRPFLCLGIMLSAVMIYDVPCSPASGAWSSSAAIVPYEPQFARQPHRQQHLERYNKALRDSRTVLRPIGPATSFESHKSSSDPYLLRFHCLEQRRCCHGNSLEHDIQRNIRILQQQGQHFCECLLRADKFFPQVTSILADEGVPEVLAYVALLESGFQPEAISASGRAGLWQLSSSIARRYGLCVTRTDDERLCVDVSTRAFARYMAQLYRQYGHWGQAIAALSPRQDYLARFLAAVRIANAPRDYGFCLDLHHMKGACNVVFEDGREHECSECDRGDLFVY
ncbi:hypothetical protein CSB45_13825 [candidate division KSB3 bacterium]|uniref:Transglycosylase SLT domain-containing protein n=1 Tax=candidate division KSB3 bacterium TaxID=2044937 RepID=A0A2G6E1E5_9BACT|nr:MAG: hypothetical protein CSB45_13825 [candidate division KSB3 bacterium]PIE28513.1 MAG: hypothetical protein CSA57_13490 [candidate division KSB3 bacterium]